MERREEEAIVSLLAKDPELKRFYEEHLELEEKIQLFQHKAYLSPAEEVEKKRLQKLKLIGKDKMMDILSKHHQKPLERETQ